MHRYALIVVAVSALLGLAVGLTIAWQENTLPPSIVGEPKVVGSIPWRLSEVSADARTLTIVHEIPHCETRPGKTTATETADRVRITVPEERDPRVRGDVVCTADMRIGTEPVRLRAPLGRRTLTQPGGKDPTKGESGLGGFAQPTPGTEECRKLDALPDHAPAREVPWVARRLRACAAPLPSAARALPILRRQRTDSDRLPASFDDDLNIRAMLLRPEQSRRLDREHEIWFIPGPVRSCIGRALEKRAFVGTCDSTAAVTRRGWLLPAMCISKTPKRVGVLGILPPGIGKVRFTTRRGAPRTIRVRNGVLAVDAVTYPFVARVGDREVKANDDFRSRC